MSSESKRSRRKRRDGVAEDGERLAMLQSVCEITCSKFGETGEPIGEALDQAQPCWPRPDRRKKSWQDRRSSLVAPVAKKAGKTHTEDRAIQPGFVLRVFRHKKRVYSRVFTMQRKLCCGWKKNRKIFQPRKLVGKIRLFLGRAIQNYTHF